MTLGSTQPLTKMSTRNRPGGKWRPARKADNFTAICEPAVYKMWEPRRLTNLWASTACYRDSFTFFLAHVTGYALNKQPSDIFLTSSSNFFAPHICIVYTHLYAISYCWEGRTQSICDVTSQQTGMALIISGKINSVATEDEM
jgi:hypothetical protein